MVCEYTGLRTVLICEYAGLRTVWCGSMPVSGQYGV